MECELKVRKEYHPSRHCVPTIISIHHTVQHAAHSKAMAEPGHCIAMEGANTTAENLMLDMRKLGKLFPTKALKCVGISLLHMHKHGMIHGDFETHNVRKFGSCWKLLDGVGVPIGEPFDPNCGFCHPPEAIVVERAATGKKSVSASAVSIPAQTTHDIWACGVILCEAISGQPLSACACRGKWAMTNTEIGKIELWDGHSIRKALQHISEDGQLLRDFISKLLHPNPELCFQSMQNILEHPFFRRENWPNGRFKWTINPICNKQRVRLNNEEQPTNKRVGKHANNINGFGEQANLSEVKETSSDSPVVEENQLNGVTKTNNSNRKPELSETTANHGNQPISPDESMKSKKSQNFGGIRFCCRGQKHSE